MNRMEKKAEKINFRNHITFTKKKLIFLRYEKKQTIVKHLKILASGSSPAFGWSEKPNIMSVFTFPVTTKDLYSS